MLLIIVDFSYHSSSSLYHYPPASTGLLFLPYTSEALSFVPVYLLFYLLSIYYLLSTIYFSTIYYLLSSHITSFRDLSSVSSPPVPWSSQVVFLLLTPFSGMSGPPFSVLMTIVTLHCTWCPAFSRG